MTGIDLFPINILSLGLKDTVNRCACPAVEGFCISKGLVRGTYALEFKPRNYRPPPEVAISNPIDLLFFNLTVIVWRV